MPSDELTFPELCCCLCCSIVARYSRASCGRVPMVCAWQAVAQIIYIYICIYRGQSLFGLGAAKVDVGVGQCQRCRAYIKM